MPTSQQSQSEIREHLAEQLDVRFAERNEVAVALYGGEAVDGVHSVDEVELLCQFALVTAPFSRPRRARQNDCA